MEKSPDAFRTISEVSDDLDLPQHVLRFWEQRFPQIRPLKRAGGRRYYRPTDIVLLRAIRQLLYDEGYTIKGVQRLLKEQGAKGLGGLGPDHAAPVDPHFDTMFDEPVDGDTAIETRVEPFLGSSPEANPAFRAGDEPAAAIAAIQEALGLVESCLAILDAVRPPRA